MSEDHKSDDAQPAGRRDATPEEVFAASEADAPVSAVREPTTADQTVYAKTPKSAA